MHIRKNLRERKVIKDLQKKGYKILTKGWPDILAYKEGDKVIMVEVKRKQKKPSKKMGLSKHQKEMHKVLRKLGIIVEVVYV